MINIEDKRKALHQIYEAFEISASVYKQHALCAPGCAFCCMHFGHVDIITLEGVIILQRIEKFAKPQKKQILKKIEKNKRDKERQKTVPCPFLKTDKTCMIYEDRPFSCRQLYSVQKCNGRGPTVHRQVVEMANETVLKLKAIDPHGYSGHLSYILHLLRCPEFYRDYWKEKFNPARIVAFGKSHDLTMNRNL